MPKQIKGKKLTAKQHRQWKHVNEKAGPAAATAAIKKSMKKGKK